MSKPNLTDEEFAELAEEVIRRLAKDPAARHLWQWRGRPACDDVPPGPSRRNHLTALLGMLGAVTLPAAVPACGGDSCGDNPPDCGDDPCGCADDPCSCADDPCTSDAGPDGTTCGDDPCGCADDPCASDAAAETCGDDPCDCGDDPCGCGDDPCACGDDPCASDAGSCGDDPCDCADDPCS